MRRDNLAALCLMLVLLAVQAAIWLPFLPNTAGRVSVDFSFWLPDLLAGYYWYLRNGLLAMPWFSPAECAGMPFHADPQVSYLSIPQLLTFVMPPVAAVRCSFVGFAACGYWGAWHLARRAFALGVSPSLLAAALFMLNSLFAVRMVVGHISYAPFMLTPAFAAALLRPPGVAPPTHAENVLRVLLGGLILAAWIEGGMVHLVPPLYLSVVAIGLIHALCYTPQAAAAGRLGLATLVGFSLCAGKLVAGIALLANLPRDLYPLPGIVGLPAALYVSLRSLCLPVGSGLGEFVVNSHIIQEPHEFEYGVGPVPAMLLLAASIVRLTTWWREGRRWKRPAGVPLALCVALAACLAIPVALNIYSPAWNAWLKSLPFFGSSSNLLRWFSAGMIPAILGGALVLHRFCIARPRAGAALAIGGVALTVLIVASTDHRHYGPPPEGIGFYDAGALGPAWQHAHDSGTPPPVTAVIKLADHNNELLMSPERENALVAGYSQLFCYAPLFGYRLEKFPFGRIRLGPALEARDGILNFKNPACYVFPHENKCAPGDHFTAAQSDELRAFLAYRPWPFAKPAYARAADWLGMASALLLPILLAWSAWHAWRERRPING